MSGLALLAGGSVAVFISTNGIGSAALVAAGAVLLFLGYAGDRLVRIKAGGFEAEMAKFAGLQKAAAIAEAGGATEVADRMRSEAFEQLRSIASSYKDLRRAMPPARLGQ